MSAADSARERIKASALALARDAAALHVELDRVADRLNRGVMPGTLHLLQRVIDLDRRAEYLRGLSEGLDLGEASRLSPEAALVVSRYEASMAAGGTGMPFTPEQEGLVDEAVKLSWERLDRWDRDALRRAGQAPEGAT